ncbi:hypothetical protein [Streptomyces sp. NPDC002990]
MRRMDTGEVDVATSVVATTDAATDEPVEGFGKFCGVGGLLAEQGKQLRLFAFQLGEGEAGENVGALAGHLALDDTVHVGDEVEPHRLAVHVQECGHRVRTPVDEVHAVPVDRLAADCLLG